MDYCTSTYANFTIPSDLVPIPLFGASRKLSLASPTATSDHSYAFDTWSHDGKFASYDSSPDSMISYPDDPCYSPIVPDNNVDSLNPGNILAHHLRHYQSDIEISSDFPIPLDSFEESLIISFLTSYADSSGWSPYLRPHPTAITVATSLATGLTAPALPHCIIAIAAQHRLSNNEFHSLSEQRSLEYIKMRHRGEAIQIVRKMSNYISADSNHNLAFIISSLALGKLDLYSHDYDTASIHVRAARQVFQTTGWASYPTWLACMMIHFELTVGTTTESYMWDFQDFPRIHSSLNAFLNEFWSFGNTISSPYKKLQRTVSYNGVLPNNTHNTKQTPYLTPDSIILECLSQTPQDLANPTPNECQELLFQLGSLLTLCNVMMTYQSDLQGMQAYLDSIHELITVSDIQHRSSKNLMWLLQFHDRSSRRTELNLAAAGWVWILRHVNYNVQRMVKDWLMAILTGRSVLRPLKLDAFAFSYAS